jgi:hypothetical protein
VTPQDHDPVGLGVGQRPQKDGIDDAEDGGVGPDAEREGQQRDQCEARLFCKRAQGVAKI